MDNERIAGFLARGLSPAQVSSIVGCTPAYISQLRKQEAFELLIETKRAEVTPDSEDAALGSKYLVLEHKIINQLETQLPFAEVKDLTRALEVVAQRQDRRAALKVPAQVAGGNNTVIVQLNMPAHAVPEVVINQQREVIAIGNKQMAPLGADGVRSLFQEIRSAKQASEAF